MKSLVALVTALCNPLVRMDQKERKEKSVLVPRKPSLFRGELFRNDSRLVQPAIEHFDGVWMGRHCTDCGRREFCGIPIARL